MSDKEINWQDDESVVRAAMSDATAQYVMPGPPVLPGKDGWYILSFHAGTPNLGAMSGYQATAGDSWRLARTHPTVQAFERTHNPAMSDKAKDAGAETSAQANMRRAMNGELHIFIEGSHDYGDSCRGCGEERTSDIHADRLAAVPVPPPATEGDANESAMEWALGQQVEKLMVRVQTLYSQNQAKDAEISSLRAARTPTEGERTVTFEEWYSFASPLRCEVLKDGKPRFGERFRDAKEHRDSCKAAWDAAWNAARESKGAGR